MTKNAASNDVQTEIVFPRHSNVERITGLSRSLIYAKIQVCKRQRPISSSSRVVRSIEAEVLAWMKAMIATHTSIAQGNQSTI
ncbi:hypothetical protein PCO31110_04740 [Pandoraea communis]|uniref:AlpA family phage regulatory protein n=1 Tax=Pandoraea communis TaxID=2508297 RepID=A0A5E4YPY4_9BURK|nr:AlpA family phage regulatory protein [Pandoraea communis]VVE50889.1 hypothetical protein PCO31110_04740 [Pandoraea communis]